MTTHTHTPDYTHTDTLTHTLTLFPTHRGPTISGSRPETEVLSTRSYGGGGLIYYSYGFRSDGSTTLALIESIEEIKNAIANKQYAIKLFIDLTKAFDTINHDTLIHKLERYGIRGVVWGLLFFMFGNCLWCPPGVSLGA